ncbi:TadE/TadG family type IV pilus assembly protein [Streptomyces sp. NPDC093600]|uniref:TadE/TadG family type IV pilus assembly protein n=1 Tax=Streptomyces sp. NPDC093600 TaxID=3366047 RepID=UPI003806AC39
MRRGERAGGGGWMDRGRVSQDRGRGRGRDRGQVAVEYLGFLPILLLVALAGIQLGLAAYAAQQAGTGARAAARAATHDDTELDPEAAGHRAMSDWIAERSAVSAPGGDGQVTATVTVDIPSVVPFWDFGTVRKSATLPMPESAPMPGSGSAPAPESTHEFTHASAYEVTPAYEPASTPEEDLS